LKQYSIDKLSKTVWRILKGMPIEVFDEEQHEMWENELWELVQTRTEGTFLGSRSIGSANIAMALNILHQQLLTHYTEDGDTNTTAMSNTMFIEILQHLQDERLIRKKPNKLRQSFKII